jgi:hypothetical protein
LLLVTCHHPSFFRPQSTNKPFFFRSRSPGRGRVPFTVTRFSRTVTRITRKTVTAAVKKNLLQRSFFYLGTLARRR